MGAVIHLREFHLHFGTMVANCIWKILCYWRTTWVLNYASSSYSNNTIEPINGRLTKRTIHIFESCKGNSLGNLHWSISERVLVNPNSGIYVSLQRALRRRKGSYVWENQNIRRLAALLVSAESAWGAFVMVLVFGSFGKAYVPLYIFLSCFSWNAWSYWFSGKQPWAMGGTVVGPRASNQWRIV